MVAWFARTLHSHCAALSSASFSYHSAALRLHMAENDVWRQTKAQRQYSGGAANAAGGQSKPDVMAKAKRAGTGDAGH